MMSNEVGAIIPRDPAAERERLRLFLGVLQNAGVAKWDGDGIKVEFWPSTAPSAPGDSAAALQASADADLCLCGHDRVSEHNAQGLCIAGSCPYTVCNPGATAKPEGA